MAILAEEELHSRGANLRVELIEEANQSLRSIKEEAVWV